MPSGAGRRWRRSRDPDRSAFAEAVLAAHAEPLIACDAHGHNLVFNAGARELFGDPPPDGTPDPWAAGDTVYDAAAGRELAADELPLARALRGERTIDAELYVRGDGGARRAFVVYAEPVLDPHGRMLGAIANLRDITGVVTPSEELRLQDRLIRHLPVAVAAIRAADGDIVYASERWAALFGYVRTELVGQHISVVNAATDRTPRGRAEDIMSALERDGVWHGEVENVRKDGSHLWTAAEVSAFEHPHEGTVWLVVQDDVSARHAAEQAAADDRRRLRSVFEDAPVAMAVVGNDLHLAEVNPALCELTGYTREELAGMSFSDLTHPDDRGGDALPFAQLRLGEIARYRREKRYVTKDGTTVPVVERVASTRDAGGEHLHDIAVVDTTDGDGHAL